MAEESIVSGLQSLTPKLQEGTIQWLGGLFFILLFGMILLYILRYKLFPIRIIVQKKVGSGIHDYFDDGKIFKVNGIEQLYIAGERKYLPKPASNLFIPTKGLFKRYNLHMIKDENGDLSPAPINSGDGRPVVAVSQDMTLWGQLQLKRLNETYNNDFWGKYGVLVGESIVAMVLIVMSFIIMNKHVEAANILAGAIREATTVLQAIKGV